MDLAKVSRLGRISTPFVWVLAVILLILSGVGYRILASRLKLVVEIPIKLSIPLSAFPTKVGDWTGKDVPIPQNIQRVAGNDDFLNRLYINKTNTGWANVYIAYTARPRTMLGHRPEVCYIGGGWVQDSAKRTEFISSFGRQIPCKIFRFHTPGLEHEERVVLNYYIVNGQLTSDESVFSGVGWRTPNIAGDPARYVAQVQISSVLENSVRTAATDMTDLILDYFPNQSGKVKAAEFHDAESTVLK
ncbi:MAG: EpsI family protein [Planctomycetota bacterium]|nr:MAG: EpsI family protein [Planctomycetota bacterium]